MKSRPKIFYLLTACLLLHGLTAAQNNKADTPKIDFRLSDLGPLKYPSLARQARISGDVKIQIQIKKDGRVAKAEILSGSPQLRQTALESAKKSKFQCNGCTKETTTFELTYTFGLREDAENCQSRPPVVGRTLDHVIILDDPVCHT